MHRPVRQIDENGYCVNWEAVLSPRQRQVAKLRAMDVSYREIAQRLGISPNTVSMYVQYVHLTLQAHSAGELRHRMGW